MHICINIPQISKKCLAQKCMQNCKCLRLHHRKYMHAYACIYRSCIDVNSSRNKNKNKSDKNATKITLLLFSRHIVRLFFASSFFLPQLLDENVIREPHNALFYVYLYIRCVYVFMCLCISVCYCTYTVE